MPARRSANTPMAKRASRLTMGAAALSLGLTLAGCGGVPSNRTLYSIHQPVVEKVNYALDLNTTPQGLAYGEQNRLAGWFQAMGLQSGDRVYLDDPGQSPATRSAVDALASRFGASLEAQAPASYVPLASGIARVVILHVKASVPGCPDWSAKADANPANATSTNYGCATNTNLAAMVADPMDLVRGATDTGHTVVMTSTKAIESYRKQEPTGAQGLKATSSTSGAGGGGGGGGGSN